MTVSPGAPAVAASISHSPGTSSPFLTSRLLFHSSTTAIVPDCGLKEIARHERLQLVVVFGLSDLSYLTLQQEKVRRAKLIEYQISVCCGNMACSITIQSVANQCRLSQGCASRVNHKELEGGLESWRIWLSSVCLRTASHDHLPTARGKATLAFPLLWGYLPIEGMRRTGYRLPQRQPQPGIVSLGLLSHLFVELLRNRPDVSSVTPAADWNHDESQASMN